MGDAYISAIRSMSAPASLNGAGRISPLATFNAIRRRRSKQD